MDYSGFLLFCIVMFGVLRINICATDTEWLAENVFQRIYQGHDCAVRSPTPALTVRKMPARKFEEYSCKNEKTLLGSNFSVCVDGQWSHDRPVCADTTCKRLKSSLQSPLPVGGDYDVIEGVRVAYRLQCGADQRLEGGAIVYCNKKVWRAADGTKLTMRNMPTCEPNVDDDNDVMAEEERMRVGDLYYKRVIKLRQCPSRQLTGEPHLGSRLQLFDVTCPAHQELIGAEYAVCVDSKWSNRPPTCQARRRRTTSAPELPSTADDMDAAPSTTPSSQTTHAGLLASTNAPETTSLQADTTENPTHGGHGNRGVTLTSRSVNATPTLDGVNVDETTRRKDVVFVSDKTVQVFRQTTDTTIIDDASSLPTSSKQNHSRTLSTVQNNTTLPSIHVPQANDSQVDREKTMATTVSVNTMYHTESRLFTATFDFGNTVKTTTATTRHKAPRTTKASRRKNRKTKKPTKVDVEMYKSTPSISMETTEEPSYNSETERVSKETTEELSYNTVLISDSTERHLDWTDGLGLVALIIGIIVVLIIVVLVLAYVLSQRRNRYGLQPDWKYAGNDTNGQQP